MSSPIKTASPGTALNVLQLFEAMVREVPSPAELAKFPSPIDLVQRVRGAEEFADRQFAGLLRGATTLVRALPPECCEPELGPPDQIRPDAALAWCISHYCDARYREARAAAGPTTEEHRHPLDPPGTPTRHPLDHFTYVLGTYLVKLMADGRAGRYRARVWLGGERVNSDPDWFVDGHLTFDALGNAIAMADGRAGTGFEAWLSNATEATNPEEDPGEEEEADVVEPSEVEKWMRLAEAQELVKPDQPLLKKVATLNACIACFAADGVAVTRSEAEKAFKWAVPPYRRRGRGPPE